MLYGLCFTEKTLSNRFIIEQVGRNLTVRLLYFQDMNFTSKADTLLLPLPVTACTHDVPRLILFPCLSILLGVRLALHAQHWMKNRSRVLGQWRFKELHEEHDCYHPI